MFTFNEPAQFLVDLERFLGRGPQDDPQELSEIALWMKQLSPTLGTETSVKAIQLLGTAVGKQWNQQYAWQDPFRRFGILAQVLQNLDPSITSPALANQYLRVIGNAVAYNDTNRELVSEYFDKLVDCLDKQELMKTALAVLYNLGQDFEPANVKAANSRLDSAIALHLATGRIPEEAIDFAMTVLNRTTQKLTPAQLDDDASVVVFKNILKISAQYEEDHFLDYLAILVHYLQDPAFQQKVATSDTIQRLLDLLLDFEVNELTKEEVHTVMQELSTQNNPNETTSDETNIVLMVRLVNSISALSASDAFVQNFTLQSSIVHKLKAKLLTSEAAPSTVCTCVMLGNLATSDQVCINMVQDMGIHKALNQLLAKCDDQALLYAAAGFSRHLAFPESNRPILANVGLIETCCHLLTKQDPSVRGEAAAILCKLVTNCYPNIKKVVYDGLPESVTYAHLPEIETSPQPTILHHIVTQALAPSAPLPSTTMKNPMIELGRTLITMLRYTRRPNSENTDEIVHQIFSAPAVARPIARLVRQRFYADARSEGLLGLGLMTQTEEGALCVINELKADEGLLDAIKEFAGEQKGDAQKSNESARRDYQNAVVLLHGLASNGGHAMDTAMKSDVDALQVELTKLMV